VKPKNAWTAFEVSQGWPNADSIGFGGVHGDASGGDHKAQEFNLMSVEQTLLGFGVQVIVMKMLQGASDVDLVIDEFEEMRISLR